MNMVPPGLALDTLSQPGQPLLGPPPPSNLIPPAPSITTSCPPFLLHPPTLDSPAPHSSPIHPLLTHMPPRPSLRGALTGCLALVGRRRWRQQQQEEGVLGGEGPELGSTAAVEMGKAFLAGVHVPSFAAADRLVAFELLRALAEVRDPLAFKGHT